MATVTTNAREDILLYEIPQRYVSSFPHLVQKPARPPPPAGLARPEEKTEPVDSGSSGEESDDDQEPEHPEEVSTKVQDFDHILKAYLLFHNLFFFLYFFI